MARYYKGERTINDLDIFKCLSEEPMQSANRLAKKLGRNYFTVNRRLNELVEANMLMVYERENKIKSQKFYTIRDTLRG